MINLTAKIIDAKGLLTKRDFEGARLAIKSVLDKDKFNYQALTLMSELEIACGNIVNAKDALKNITDITPREWAVFSPLIILTLWMGIYPAPFLDIIHVSVENLIQQVQLGQINATSLSFASQ